MIHNLRIMFREEMEFQKFLQGTSIVPSKFMILMIYISDVQ